MAVAHVASGAWANATTTSIAPAISGTTVAGELLVAYITGRYSTAQPPTATGWTIRTITNNAGGTGTNAENTGTTDCWILTKETAGGESGTVTFTISGNNHQALISRFSKSAGTWGLAGTGGVDTTLATSYSATGATIDLASGDMLLSTSVIANDATTFSAQSLTASGITFGSGTIDVADAGTTQGSDQRAGIYRVTATAGSATVAPVYTMTLSAADAGSTAFLRIRQVGGDPGTVARVWSVNTPDGGVVTAKTTGATSVRLAVSTNSGMTSPTYVAAQTPDAQGRVRFTVTGKSASTQYYYQCADTPSGGSETLVGPVGKLRTLPTAGSQANFTFAPHACITTNAADSTAMDDLRTWDPLFAPSLGDLSYFGPTSTSAETHATGIESQIVGAAGLDDLLRDVSVPYCRSDHDTTNVDNGDSNTATNQASIDAYKLYAPYYTLADAGTPTDGLYQSWVVGRVRFILLDVRHMDRSPGLDAQSSSKTMLGATQLAWLLARLDEAEPVKVILSDVGWMGPASTTNGEDKWWSYDHERQTIIDHIQTNEIRVELFHGDSHLIGTTSAANNTYGGFPVSCCAPMHNVGGGRNTGEFDWFFSNATGDCRQYMRVTVTDNGSSITFLKQGWDAVTDTVKGSETTVWDLSVTGTASATQASNTAAASGQLRYTATAATTQANNTATATGKLGYTATAAATQASDTATATGKLGYSGTVAVTQAANTSAAVGKLGYSGAGAAIQAGQTASAVGNLAYSGTANPSQAAQAAIATGKLGYTGTAASTQTGDTAAASGVFTVAGVSGSAAPAQTAQTATAAGTLVYAGSVSASQADQGSTASGKLVYTSTVSVAQAGNTAAAVGVINGGIAGTVAAAQQPQTSTASGQLRYTGTAAASQSANTALGSGLYVPPASGTAAVTQDNQTAAATAQLRYSATVTATQSDNSCAAIAVYFIPAIGAVAATQNSQTCIASGSMEGQLTERPNQGTTPRTASGATARTSAGVTPRL